MAHTDTQRKLGNMAYVSSAPTTPRSMDPPGLGPKKTFFVLVTVVGCIAILWPKVFHPMIVGSGQDRTFMSGSGCCDVVLDSDEFANVSTPISSLEHPKIFRKNINLFTGEISIRQERPLHMRPDAIHPAMRERGRAIPSTQTVPIVEKTAPVSTPGSSHVIDGRPRPMPNLPRPPMGAGSNHQAGPKSTNTMGFVMPLYTIGIVSFFVYTLMKIVMKKSNNSSPYPIPPKEDPNFRNIVFGQHEYKGYKRPEEPGSSKLENNETKHPPASSPTTLSSTTVKEKEQLMEITLLRKKLQETESAMANIIVELGKVSSKKSGNENPADVYQVNGQVKATAEEVIANGANEIETSEEESSQRKKRDLSSERASFKVLGMEMTASCERWSGRPPTPIFSSHFQPHSPSEDADRPEPQKIFLEGALPHESQILVADSAVTEENVETDNEDDPAIVLSSKMTLSLISLDPPEDKDVSDVEDKENHKPDTGAAAKENYESQEK